MNENIHGLSSILEDLWMPKNFYIVEGKIQIKTIQNLEYLLSQLEAKIPTVSRDKRQLLINRLCNE